MKTNCLKEKRKFPRLNEPVFILCHCKQSEMRKGITGNISRKGLMFDTDMPMSIQDSLFLEIYQPTEESKEEIIALRR